MSKGIDSVRVNVINLKEIKPDLSVEYMKEAIKKSFIKLYGNINSEVSINPIECDRLKKIANKYSSWKWRFGRTPDFNLKLEHCFKWGDIKKN
jgi:lipoate---protein ligase